MRLVILPGMDGSATLLGPFCEALGPSVEPVVVEYPTTVAGYEAIEALVRERLDAWRSAPLVLLAQSFSGPVAIRIAADPPPHLAALVLVATFVVPPAPAWTRRAITAAMFSLPPPRAFLRRTLLAPDAGREELDVLRASIRRVPPRVLAARARAALAVDVRDELSRVELPVLLIEGRRDRLVRSLASPALRPTVIDAPHLVLQHAPSASARAVAGLLRAIAER